MSKHDGTTMPEQAATAGRVAASGCCAQHDGGHVHGCTIPRDAAGAEHGGECRRRVACPAWADCSPGQHDHEPIVDRVHFSEQVTVAEALDGMETCEPGEGWRRQTLTAYLRQGVREAEPIVQLDLDDRDMLRLTLGEALALAQVLERLVEQGAGSSAAALEAAAARLLSVSGALTTDSADPAVLLELAQARLDLAAALCGAS